jgi:NADH-ubiquinone oxidoreductase chain 5
VDSFSPLEGVWEKFLLLRKDIVQIITKVVIFFDMMMAIGLSQYNVALMHTVNHAFFKALLFLGAGAVIHSFADQQDVRKMGGLIKFLPFTYSVMLTGSLSLLATPYLTGFYSKDLILELAFGQYNFSGIYAYILGSITAGITAFYSFRLISLVFLTTPNGNKQSYINSISASPKGQERELLLSKKRESDPALAVRGGCHLGELEKLNLIVIFPLLLLALFSIFFGFAFSDLFVGMGSDFFQNSIFMHPKNISLIEAEFSLSAPPLMEPAKTGYSSYSIFFKLLPAILSFTGALSAFFLYHLPTIPLSFGEGLLLSPLLGDKQDKERGLFLINLTNNKTGRNIYAFLNGKYYFDVIYNHFIIQSGLKLGYNISKEIDRGVIELLGPYGLSNYFYNAGKNLAKLDTGVITTYSLYITLALISLLFILFSPALALATNYFPGSLSRGEVINPQSLEEIRLFIIYITSALIVLSPYPPVAAEAVKG